MPRTSPCPRRRGHDCTSSSRTGWRARSSSSATRSSATTSSRRTATAGSSTRKPPSCPASPAAQRSTSPRRAGLPSTAVTSALHARSSSAATAVLPQDDEQDSRCTPELADVYQETADKRAFEILDEARVAGDPITRARAGAARHVRSRDRGQSGIPRDERARCSRRLAPVFEAEGHDLGLAEYWRAEA